MIDKLNIKGFRGFGSDDTEISFAIPNGIKGSGITMIVGENNSGKSSILECIKLFGGDSSSLSISEAKRNKLNNDRVEISLLNTNIQLSKIYTISSGGSELIKEMKSNEDIIYIPSRRAFQKNFGKNDWNIQSLSKSGQHMNNTERIITYDEFTYLFTELNRHRNAFNQTLSKVIDFPDWTLDLNESNQYYLKVKKGTSYHNSEGLGEGMVSILTMIGTLFLSKSGSTVLIDEPELSIHPEVSKKILNLLIDYSKDRQIIISTHSPYFIDLESLVIGAKLIRVVNESNSTKTYSLNNESIEYYKSQLANNYFPHATGNDSKEIFFKSDKIVVVEGQEDVIGYTKSLRQLSLPELSFYGWGAGGASNITKVIGVLKNLGFKKISAIYDGDKLEMYNEAKKTHIDVDFHIIDEDDIRDKNICGQVKNGIMTSGFILKSNYQQSVTNMFNNIRKFLYE